MVEEQTLRVASNRKDDRVALFEKDERHPGGEAFVAGSKAVEVFPTPAVKMLLSQEVLVEVVDEEVIPEATAEPAGPADPIPLGRVEEAPELPAEPPGIQA